MGNSVYSFFHYWFYPNPGLAGYNKPSIIALIVICAVLIIGSFALSYWRSHLENAVTKKLSKTWSSVMFWFGIVGIIMVISRVHQIQFFAMRFLWVLWVLGLAVYGFLQMRIFRSRHYEVIKQERVIDPRDRYLPGKKKR